MSWSLNLILSNDSFSHQWVKSLFGILCWLLVQSVDASEQKALVEYAVCASCHGEQGQGNDGLNAPALAGQFDWYLQRQLQSFASGVRGDHPKDAQGKIMQPFANSLREEQQLTLSTWLERLPIVKTETLPEGDLKNGSRYYQARCGACHGGNGEGNQAFQAPRLNHLSSAYLLRQMKHFKQGIRGTQKKDKYGRQMALMAKTVSDKELKDIVFYLSQVSE